MKRLLLFIILCAAFTRMNAQPVQIGLGYGMGYYHWHLTNLDVFAMEYNAVSAEDFKIKHTGSGPTVELVLGKDGKGFLLNWMMRSNTFSAGSDQIRARVRRTGFGFKYATSQLGFGFTFDFGKVRMQARTGSAEWGGLFSTDKDLYLGNTIFADVYAFGRFGLRAYWMWEWLNSEFGSIENFKFNFSNVGLEVTLYLFRNGGDE